MRRIVVSLLKGGVAKSETAVSLAHGLALKGHKVLLVDTDVQAQCNDMLGVEPEKGLAELIAGWASPEEALAQARENLWLLAGGVPLAGVKMEIARREMAPEAVLDETLSCYEDQFDVMVMDTAPGWDTLLVNALYCSREVISPVSMEPVALKGLRRFEERLGVIQKYQPALALKWIVPTFVDGRVKKTAHIMEQLQAEFGDRLTDSIRYSVKLSEAPEFGKTIFEHDPRGAGAKGYRALVERVLRDAPMNETFIVPPKIEQAAPPPINVSPPEPAPQFQEPKPLPEAAVPAPSVEPPAPLQPSPPVMEEAPLLERPEAQAQGLTP
ncbi:MAG: ParA family protein, partial [Proteobacteria bacterium]|nr:ParA family protein [Pseudomonadota bacterium]